MRSGKFIGGVALGLLVGFIVGLYGGCHASRIIRGRTAEHPRSSERTIQIVCSAQDLPSGHVISRTDLARIQVLESEVSADRLITPDDAPLVLGRKLLFPVRRGQPILWADIEGGPARTNEAGETQ